MSKKANGRALVFRSPDFCGFESHRDYNINSSLAQLVEASGLSPVQSRFESEVDHKFSYSLTGKTLGYEPGDWEFDSL